MAEFLIKMADERGHVLEQVESGVSEQDIRERLAQQGFLVYSVEGTKRIAVSGLWEGTEKMRNDEFIIFNQQLPSP